MAAASRVLERVAENIREDLLEPHVIGPKPARSRSEQDIELLPVLRDRGPERFGQLEEHAMQIDRLRAHRRHVATSPGDDEQVLDQPGETRALTLEHAACVVAPRRVAVVLDQIECGAHRRERLSHFMGDTNQDGRGLRIQRASRFMSHWFHVVPLQEATPALKVGFLREGESVHTSSATMILTLRQSRERVPQSCVQRPANVPRENPYMPDCGKSASN
jgi:hypothetical protein